jgi:hypothetical protein
LVRVETVITGGRATREFYCGACERTWRETLADNGPEPLGPRNRREE